jgi:acetyltransferase-like isoleucine patch superfamily enzyme
MKFCLIKVFHIKTFRFTFLNLVSPFTEVQIGRNAKLTLGKRIRMRSGSKISLRKGAEMTIGKDSSLNHGCIFTAHERIIVGENVQFGPNVLIYDHDHDYKKENGMKNLDYKTSPVEIGDNTWIGANVVILRGVRVGRNCVVAAGTILTECKNRTYGDNSLIYQKRDTIVKQYIISERK